MATARGGNRWNEAQVVAHSLATGDRQVLVDGGSDARYLPSGHLVYVRGDTLFAQPFDLERLAPTGSAVDVSAGIARGLAPIGEASRALYGVGGDGTLFYVPSVEVPFSGTNPPVGECSSRSRSVS